MSSAWSTVRQMFSSNLAYKLVALFVTLILWFTIQGRKDTVSTRDMRVEYIVPPQVSLADPVIREVRVKVAGPRSALKKFVHADESIILDLNGFEPGWQRVSIDQTRINLPVGVKVLSIVPKVIKLRIVDGQGQEEGGRKNGGSRRE